MFNWPDYLVDTFVALTEEEKYSEWSEYWMFTSGRGNVPLPYESYCRHWEGVDTAPSV